MKRATLLLALRVREAAVEKDARYLATLLALEKAQPHASSGTLRAVLEAMRT